MLGLWGCTGGREECEESGEVALSTKSKEGMPKNSRTRINDILMQYFLKSQISKLEPIGLQPILINNED